MTRLTEARKSRHQTQTPLTQRNRIILGPLVNRRTHIMAKTGQGLGKEKSPQWFAVEPPASVVDLAVKFGGSVVRISSYWKYLGTRTRAKHYPPKCSASNVLVIARHYMKFDNAEPMRLMSALGHKRTYAVQKGMSALPPIADMCGAKTNVRLVPIADIGLRSL